MLRNSNSGLGIFHGTTVWTKLVLQLWVFYTAVEYSTNTGPHGSISKESQYPNLVCRCKVSMNIYSFRGYIICLPWSTDLIYLEKAAQYLPPTVPAELPALHWKGKIRVLVEKTYHSSFHRLALRGDSVAGTWSPRLHSQHQVCHCWWIFGWDLVCCFQWNVKWGIKMACTTRQKALHCITDLS